MKKTLVLVLIVLMAATALFAEAGVGGWGRVWTEVGSTDNPADPLADETQLDFGPGWGGDGARVRHDVFGNSDDVGFRAEVDGDTGNAMYNGTYGVGEFLYIWVKPVEMLKLSAGKFQIDNMRGGIGGVHGSNGDVLGIGDLEDKLFSRMRFPQGLAFELSAAEGVMIQGGLLASPAAGEENTLEEATKSIQIGGQYKIEGVGRIRAQYIGEQSFGGNIGSEVMEAAFEYTGMEGLKADVGIKYDTNSDTANPTQVNIAVDYTMDKINATLGLFNYIDDEDDYELDVFLRGIYNLDAGYSARIEVQYQMQTDNNILGIFPYVQKGLANGKMSLGFKYNSYTDAEYSEWAIPLLFEYWF